MKNIQHIMLAGVSTLSVFVSASMLHAATRSNDPMDYLYKNEELSPISVGAYVGQAEREISRSGPRPDTIMTSTRSYGYLGYDVTPWMNVYGMLGVNEAELTGSPTADAEMLLGGGISFNLLNRFVRDPIPYEDAFRINADLRAISTEADFILDSVSWQEYSASLRFSLVNFPTGDKTYRPEAIALYAGPMLSWIQSSEISSTDEVGLFGGVEIFLYDGLSLDLQAEYVGEASVFGGINVRF